LTHFVRTDVYGRPHKTVITETTTVDRQTCWDSGGVSAVDGNAVGQKGMRRQRPTVAGKGHSDQHLCFNPDHIRCEGVARAFGVADDVVTVAGRDALNIRRAVRFISRNDAVSDRDGAGLLEIDASTADSGVVSDGAVHDGRLTFTKPDPAAVGVDGCIA